MATVDELTELIVSELENYTEEIDQKMQKEIDKVAKEVKIDLDTNPNIPKRTGEYSRKFYIKKEAQGMGYKRVRVANKKYQLTHLLEYGHALINGGRTRAYKHWESAQEIADTLPERMEEIIKNGT